MFSYLSGKQNWTQIRALRIQEGKKYLLQKNTWNVKPNMLLKKKILICRKLLSFEEGYTPTFHQKHELGHFQLVLSRHLPAAHNQNHLDSFYMIDRLFPNGFFLETGGRFRPALCGISVAASSASWGCFLPDFSLSCPSFIFTGPQMTPSSFSQVSL